MHDLRVRAEARRLIAAGRTVQEAAEMLGLSSRTVAKWRALTATDHALPARCPICTAGAIDGATAGSYAYLLGQYLGDGHLVTSARVPVLRISACTDYPQVATDIRDAIVAVRGTVPGGVRGSHSDRVLNIQSYWTHWPCLLPQHGPGRKHERPIVLADWQRAIVEAHPWSLIRGLIHSDGCRVINRVVVHGKAYEYPRYFFSNESVDIQAIFTAALDEVGVRWRNNRGNSVSIARRASVARLDEHVGPKR
jgi:hypothetical protein